MKELALTPDKPFVNNVDVTVYDFPKGREEGRRKRCGITVEFAESDVAELQDRGMDYEAALDYYKKYIYNLITANIGPDWQCVEGWDQVMGIVEDHVRAYY